MPRILYLLPGPVPPPRDPRVSRYYHLSEIVEGDVLLPTWLSKPEGDYREGRFLYHFCFCPPSQNKIRRFVARLTFFLRAGLRIARSQQPRPVIMSYGTGTTGLAALMLKWLTGAKLIIEVPGVPQSMNRFDNAVPRWTDRLHQRLFEWTFVFIVSRADHVKLLYPSQLAAFPALRDAPTSVFHNLVPAHLIEPGEAASDDKYILFLGFPWYRKGADTLVRAFREIADEFPGHTLKLVGAGLDDSRLRGLAEGCERIEFNKPVGEEAAHALMTRCSVFVLPSRSEAMGRVLLEAMAARRTIVASAVDGIPHYLRDGTDGLLFEPANHEDLAAKLRAVLSDPALAERLARSAYERLHAEFDEQAHVRGFARMLETVAGRSAQPVVDA